MKTIRLLLICLLPVLAMSCTDTREELEIKQDGSGTMSVKTDVGKLLEIVQGFAQDSDLAKQGLDKPMDTIMLMKDYVDTAKDIPAEKKELLRNGKAHVVVNMKENIGKFDMTFPFSSTANLQKLYASLNSSSGGFGKLLEGMNKNGMPGAGGDSKNDQMPQVASVYDIAVTNKSYSRKVNKERYAEFSKSIKLDELNQMSGMLGEMDYTFSLKVPRPIKKVSNPKAMLSEDKKHMFIKTDLMQTLQHPELLEVEVEY